MCKIFADDTSLFSKVIDKNNSNSQFNSDLAKISKWAFQWNMSSNSNPNKQAIEVRSSKENYLPLQFNSTDIHIADCNWTQTHNHLVHKRTLNHLAKWSG